jgi:hypothetical protein
MVGISKDHTLSCKRRWCSDVPANCILKLFRANPKANPPSPTRRCSILQQAVGAASSVSNPDGEFWAKGTLMLCLKAIPAGSCACSLPERVQGSIHSIRRLTRQKARVIERSMD